MPTSTALGYNSPFSIESGFGGFVQPIAIQSDGKILVGGGFASFTGSSQNRFIRLDSNGSKDSTFNIGNGFSTGTRAISIQSDGKIIVGGDFTFFSGISQNYLVRLNSNGSKDTSFDIGTGFNSLVLVTSIQSDGKVIVGGAFTTFTGSSQNYLVRLNSNGSRDTSFNIGTGFDGSPQSISIQSDGKIIVGGVFSTFTGSSQNYLIRLNSDGSKDTSFNIGTGFNGFVYSTAIQSDGKILVGGGFTTFSGSSQNNLIRLNSDGSRDTSFNIGTGFGTVGQGVLSIEIQSDGKILAGGSFTTFTGSTQNKLIRLNSDGSRDTSFNIGTGFNGDIYSTPIQSGKIFVGGNFTTFSGISQNYLVRLNSIGSIFTGTTITGTQQIGDLSVATASTVNYSTSTNGGVTFWMGPDEDLGYVIGIPVPLGNQTTPIVGVNAFLGFYRSTLKTEASFVSLVNGTFNQSLTTGASAKTYLNNNGYWTSYV